MAYATQADLVPLRLTQKDLNELTIDDDPGQPPIDPISDVGKQIVAQVTGAALEEASGRVESYCRQRYVTPLQQSDDVKALTLDITIYLLFSRRRETRISDTVQQRFDQAIGFLKDISNGKASLDQPVTAQLAQSGSGEAVVTRKPERFSDRNLDGYTGGDHDQRSGTFPYWWGM
jgi:phage gp36-like protein